MHIGLAIPTCKEGLSLPVQFCTPHQVVQMAVRAEQLGFHSVWGNDHITPPKYVRDDYAEPPNFNEPLITLAFCAQATSRLRIGTSVLVLPMRAGDDHWIARYSRAEARLIEEARPVPRETDRFAVAFVAYSAARVHQAAKRVQAEIGGGVLVNLGSDLSIAGDPPAGGWLVRVTDDHAASPTDPGQTIALLAGGLATSSTTVRRWEGASGPSHHIVDPRTGESATEVWRTVSVAAGSCVDANAASTAAIVRGETAPAWLSERRLPSRLVRGSGDVVVLCDWPEADLP